MTKKAATQRSVSPAARHSSTDPVYKFLEPLGVMQEQAAVKPSGDVELPETLRQLVEDARRQGDPAFVIHAVLRTAKVSHHLAEIGSRPAPLSLGTLAKAETTVNHSPPP
jgi:hypothetical protein